MPLLVFACFVVSGFSPFAGGCLSVSASTHVYMIFGFEAASAIPILPFGVSGNPPPFTSFHVSPASVLFQSPLPGPPLCRKYGPLSRSQLDAQSVRLSVGSIARSTKPARLLMNFTWRHVVPPSVLL